MYVLTITMHDARAVVYAVVIVLVNGSAAMDNHNQLNAILAYVITRTDGTVQVILKDNIEIIAVEAAVVLAVLQ